MTLYPWHSAAWSQLQQMRAQLPHALLFHGPSGTGKADFLDAFAKSLLCENVASEGHACGQCASCGWFAQNNHPDFRRVRPENLEDELPGEADDEDGERKSKTTKAPSKEIKIEQIRTLSDFMNISTHRQGLRVVVLYPAESLNMPAANALLKTLEEPPAGTVFLVAAHSLDRVLPTILSRCRKFALPTPAHDAALTWLTQQGVNDAESWLCEQGGAPLAALERALQGGREEQDLLLQFLARPNQEMALRTADKLAKTELTAVVTWTQRWLYDLSAVKLSGTVRYYPRLRRELEALAARCPTSKLLATVKAVDARRKVAEHPLSPKLFIEDLLLDVCSCCQ